MEQYGDGRASVTLATAAVWFFFGSGCLSGSLEGTASRDDGSSEDVVSGDVRGDGLTEPWGCGYTIAGCPPGFECDIKAAASSAHSVPGFCVNAATDEVFIPEGEFWMGCREDELIYIGFYCKGLETGIVPQHLVQLSAYAIDRMEVSVAEYRACVDAGVCTAPELPSSGNYTGWVGYGEPDSDDLPVNLVSWDQADTYCRWPGKPAGAQRLPTEAEWERAARGGCETLGTDCRTSMRIYPWGNGLPHCGLANLEDCDWSSDSIAPKLSPIGIRPSGVSPYGVHDMSGNVSEWVQDWFSVDYYEVSPTVNPQGPESGDFRVSRGSNFQDWASQAAVAMKRFAWRVHAEEYGFRCARSIGPRPDKDSPYVPR